MDKLNLLTIALGFLILNIIHTVKTKNIEIERPRCENRHNAPLRPNTKYLNLLEMFRMEMQSRVTLHGAEINAYIMPSFDEHHNYYVAFSDKRLQNFTGFQGNYAFAAITLKKQAIWLERKDSYAADEELDCEWKMYDIESLHSLPNWLSDNLYGNMTRIGADSKLIPHYLWEDWERKLQYMGKSLLPISRNLFDKITYQEGSITPSYAIKNHLKDYTGEDYLTKVKTVRNYLSKIKCDAIIISSLTEIAYILNVRGNDMKYVPVFKGFVIITQNEIFLYTNKLRERPNHLKLDTCFNADCVIVREYNEFWNDLRTNTQLWNKIFLPTHCAFDHGVSEAIYSLIPKHKIYQNVSPILLMKAEKNHIEREGMRNAAIQEGVAFCEFFSYFERKFSLGEKWTERSAMYELELSLNQQDRSKGLSQEIIIAYGIHTSLPYYRLINITNINISDSALITIQAGAHFKDGTTKMSRSVHLGKPTNEQKRAYTSVLQSLIRISTLVFLDNLKPIEVDALARGPVWETNNDYPNGIGHGVGSFLSVRESPINLEDISSQNYSLRDGYFFYSQSGFYKQTQYGIQLGNILEVYDTGKRYPTRSKYLAFKDVTLIPFQSKLIDRSLLSVPERKWLNEYNTKVRTMIGNELKKKKSMYAFYWLMNQTTHINEYLPKSEYKNDSSKFYKYNFIKIIIGFCTTFIIQYQYL